MPTTRTRKKRCYWAAIAPEEAHFLLHGDLDGYENPSPEMAWLFTRPRREWRVIWESVREKLLKYWLKDNPGTRPWAWWEFDAPRWDVDIPRQRDGKPPEPRRRVDGSDLVAPGVDPVAFLPFLRGIPMEVWDEGDPAEFESEADYLRRHKLLTAAERKKRLAYTPTPSARPRDRDRTDQA